MQYSPKILSNTPGNGNGNGSRVTLQLRMPRAGAEEENVSQNAEELINGAREQAKQILDEAYQQAEKKARQAEEKAYQQGYEKGYQDAVERAEKEAEQIRQQARQVLSQAEEERGHTLNEMEGEILKLGMNIAEKIVACQLSLDNDTILSITREAIDMLKVRDKLTIYINPEDSDVLHDNLYELHKMVPAGTSINILTDENITPGGCTAESGKGRVDASLDTRWCQVMKSLGLREAE
ncbi:MAG: flagellar biosynthesis protein [Clostridiales bacterium]|nr:flagellar biosynthesis protein [Clostridiales bacterium]MCF8021720.1 flagellar biosynthesis protein [Clostridiales bacterium]